MAMDRNSKSDWALFSCYFPTRPTSKKDEPNHKKPSKRIVAWHQKGLDELPLRAVPIIGMDLNDGLGLAKLLGKVWAQAEHVSDGPGASQQEHFAAVQLK